VPEVGRESLREVEATVNAMEQLCKTVRSTEPEVLVMAGPHGLQYWDAIGVVSGDQVRGTLGAFGAPEVSLEFSLDAGTRQEVIRAATQTGLEVREARADLDHGFLVPLYYIRKAGVSAPLVLLGPGALPTGTLYRMGLEMARTFTKRVAFIASGDLSHRLKRGAPAGYHRMGQVFDDLVVKALREGDAGALLNMDENLVEQAGQCGLRPVAMLSGVAKDSGGFQVLSYEGPFGVGYLVAQAVAQDYMVSLARRSLEAYVRCGRIIEPDDVPPEFSSLAGVFVSIYSRGRLRGCIGTIAPTKGSAALEVVENAIAAGTQDPRFPAVRAWELGSLTYSVDVLGEPEPVSGLGDLDARVYGVLVEKGDKRGVLLPGLDGVDTPAEQVAIASQKAGLRPGEHGVRLYRFKVTRFGKKG
jgi:AmmeMemoRadiSam system protein A